jgi:UDP-N-acetylglucosamine 2-epimerase
MVGNSSSGILEAPSFALPVVNVGTRQGGRLRAGEVVDVPVAAPAITAALAGVLARPRRKGVVASAFGDGRAAARIRALLEGFASETPAARLAKEGA